MQNIISGFIGAAVFCFINWLIKRLSKNWAVIYWKTDRYEMKKGLTYHEANRYVTESFEYSEIRVIYLPRITEDYKITED